MKKIVTVVGARPQFIKEGIICRCLREKFNEVLVHTGQHYDYNMSEEFFKEFNIPDPDYNLGISGGSHSEMTGRMMIRLEEIFRDEYPAAVLLYGDTNSTLAAALAATKMKIPVIHVESGPRERIITTPEEINRICTDHISSLRFACTEASLDNLKKEGLSVDSYFTGDPMYDAFLSYRKSLRIGDVKLNSLIDDTMVELPEHFYYMTCHHSDEWNMKDPLENILNACEKFDAKVIFPVHPRNNNTVKKILTRNKYKNIMFVKPVGYIESVALISNAKKIVTDSGGVQREAFFAEKPCLTIAMNVSWPETLHNNCNQIVSPNTEEILHKIKLNPVFEDGYKPFGDGNCAERIVGFINDYIAKWQENPLYYVSESD